MERKHAEGELVRFLKRHNFYWHKYSDIRQCPHCHTLLPKSERMPDYAVAPVYTYIECKNAPERWGWVEIAEGGARTLQREWLTKTGGWLFIVLGDKPAPAGKSAYLIPFDKWLEEVEPKLIELDMKSLRRETIRDRPGADQLLAAYRLDWITGEGWDVPDGHIWIQRIENGLFRALDMVNSWKYLVKKVS